MSVGQSRPCPCESWLDPNGSLKLVHGPLIRLISHEIPLEPPTKIRFIGLRIDSLTQRATGGCYDLNPDLLSDLRSDDLLQRKDVLHLPHIAIGPKLPLRTGADESGRDPHAILRTCHGALDQSIYTQPPSYLWKR